MQDPKGQGQTDHGDQQGHRLSQTLQVPVPLPS